MGRGYRGGQNTQPINANKLPNLEDPNQPIRLPGDKPAPAGFGFIAATWKPRIDYAGTYDEVWQKKRSPYLPTDFNSKFFNMASTGLVCRSYLQGNETVTMVHLTPEPYLQFQLPQCGVRTEIKIAGATETPIFNLETLFFEPDEKRFMMTWRAKQLCDKKALKVSEVHIYSNFDEHKEVAA